MSRWLVLIAATGVAASAHAFDFKGIEIGAPASAKDVSEKIKARCNRAHQGIQTCRGQVTIVGSDAKVNVIIGSGGNVQRIFLSFSPEAFEAVSAGLIEKFGPPTSTQTSTLQNRMGAQYEQVNHLWRDQSGNAVTLQRFTGSLDTSTLLFITPEEAAAFNDRAKDKTRDL